MSTSSVFEKPRSSADVDKIMTSLNTIPTILSPKQAKFRYFASNIAVSSSYKYIKITLKDATTKRFHIYLVTPEDWEAYYNTLLYETSGNTIYIQEIYKGSKLTMTKSGNEIVLYRNATTSAILIMECIGTSTSAIQSVTVSTNGSSYINIPVLINN